MSAAELTLPARMPDVIIKVVTATAAAKAAGQSADQLLEFAKIVPICRVHQEDFCQALRVHPSLKYQNDGGPGPKQIIDLIRAHAPAPVQDKYRGKPAIRDEDVMVFLDALIFNWLVCGTDAHAKNYSLLIGGGGLVRLAPFYDIATILAYPDIDPRKAKLAMKIGDAYGVFDIGIRDWLKLSSSLGIAGDALVFRIREMIKNLPGHIDQVSEQIRKTGLLYPVLHRLAETLKERATELSRL